MKLVIEVEGQQYTIAVAGGELMLLAAILEEQKKQTGLLEEILESNTGQKRDNKRKAKK
jgi:hypothetical protein